jgi:hypothetical protein
MEPANGGYRRHLRVKRRNLTGRSPPSSKATSVMLA